ncbi:MAG: FAD-dependent oxidoreductase [Flavobacteriaceae bacterium]|nr:FAD-dependent oxidoreductase [Flavobacteriaceae bacterium]
MSSKCITQLIYMDFDVLIIGGGVAGMSCALLFGSAEKHPFVKGKKIGIIIHQRSSSLQNAVFNNVLGVAPNTFGKDILENGKNQLQELYPTISLIENEKALSIEKKSNQIIVNTNKNEYTSEKIIVAVGPKNFAIKGLEEYTELHSKLPSEKQRTQLKNTNHIVDDGIYVVGVLAGLRSQFAIASGSGVSVATDILSEWNNGNPVKVHDSVTLQ